MNDQRGLAEQMRDLHAIAIERGMYDAADWMVSAWTGTPALSHRADSAAPATDAPADLRPEPARSSSVRSPK